MTETDTQTAAPEATAVTESYAALDQRLTELEAVVHALTPPNHLTAGGHVGEWLCKAEKKLANVL